MNFLKSIFISSYMMLIMAVSAYSGWILYQGPSPIYQNANQLAWTGALLTSTPMLIVLSALMMFKRHARTSKYLPIPNLLGVTGMILSAWAVLAANADITALSLASMSWIGFLLYAYWFSTYGNRQTSTKLIAGNKLPKFSVRGADGEYVTSAQLTDRPAILIFYRGNWCPLCIAQIKELVVRYKEISSLGVRVALIAPQPHKNTVALARKFDVPFEFLTDEGNTVARALGIEHANGLPMGMQLMGYDSDTVLPTVIITDWNGKILWTHETDNYRIRPEPDVYLDVLRSHGLATAA